VLAVGGDGCDDGSECCGRLIKLPGGIKLENYFSGRN